MSLPKSILVEQITDNRYNETTYIYLVVKTANFADIPIGIYINKEKINDLTGKDVNVKIIEHYNRYMINQIPKKPKEQRK